MANDPQALEVLNKVCQTVATELDLGRALQAVTNAAVELSGARFGAFFYRDLNDQVERHRFYTLAGAPCDGFSRLPTPRKTQLFAPTFEGRRIVRIADVLADPRYGSSESHQGAPEGYLPMRAYLGAPVVSRSGDVLGGLFLGHSDVGVFDERAETLTAILSTHAAIAIDTARSSEKGRRAETALRSANTDLASQVAENERRVQDLHNKQTAAEIGARETAELFRLMVENVVDYAIYMLTPDGRVATWNGGASRIKGYTAEEIIGTHFSRFYAEEDVAGGRPEITLATARTTGRFEGQGWRVRKDGSRFWASVIVDPVYDEDRTLIGFAKVTRDITEQREAQIALERTREALFQSQKMETIGQLTGGIAHDFNNMLAGILGALHMLRARLDDGRAEDARRYLDLAIDSGKRAAGLTSRLLAFGRRQSLDIKPVDVRIVVESMEELLRRTIGENVRLILEMSAPQEWARTDANQLESALLNLAINARDAMPDGGMLTITVQRRMFSQLPDNVPGGDYVSISVRDTGVGMPADVVERAFDPFFTTKPIGVGTGLGLSMVHGFVNQSGGAVRIASAPGAGTEVVLYLPGANVDAERAPALESDDRAARETEIAAGKTVLVVEDEPLVRMLIVDVLSDLGFTAVEARNAEEALRQIDTGRPIDLMLSDVGLPGLNGRQLAEIARRRRPNLKVLFLTGYAEHAMRRSEFLGPGMDMMVKPFEVEKLSAKIAEIVTDA